MNHLSLYKLSAAAMAISAVLSGCYVVPVQPDGRAYPYASAPAAPGVGVAPATAIAPLPTTSGVRLYPTNDRAASIGIVQGQVTNFLDGHGQFSAQIGGEQFIGEATRLSSSKSGTANGVGNRGSYLQCTYAMNHATQGTGTCVHSNGAQFKMHIGG